MSGIDGPRSNRSTLLGLEITVLILAKLRSYQSFFNFLATQSPLSGEELSYIISQPFLYTSKVVEGLDHSSFELTSLEKPQGVI